MQGRNGYVDIENSLVDTVREGTIGTNGKSSTDIYTPPYGKQIVDEKLHGEHSLALCNCL